MRGRDSEVFGKVPGGASHWSVRRKGDLTWEWCTFANNDGVARQEFPIGELSLGTIRERWGAGTYRLMFLSLGNGIRQVHGNGKIFELTARNRGGTPRPIGRVRDAEPETSEGHEDMVRALLKAAQGKSSATELYETLAIPTGMGLSALFSAQERLNERLDRLEKRLGAIEEKLTDDEPASAPASSRLDRLLDRLENIEGHLARAAPVRRASPSGRRTPRS